MRVELAGREAAYVARSLVSSALGRVHGYYAYYAIASGVAHAAILRLRGRVAGVEIFYRARVGKVTTCIHYYVVVRRELRGQGLGKVLVVSVEELCRANFYLATTKSDNIASRKMFSSLCYSEHYWYDLESAFGWDAVYELARLTCGFEDEVLLVKSLDGKLGDLVNELLRYGVPERLWRKICYEPWMQLVYG
jgi:GNAT superfamily N-acetyltransferase